MNKFYLIIVLITLLFTSSYVKCEETEAEFEAVLGDEHVELFFNNIINGFRSVHNFFNNLVNGDDDQPPNNPPPNEIESPVVNDDTQKHKFCDKIIELRTKNGQFSEDPTGQATKYLPNSNICWRVQPKDMKRNSRVMLHFNAMDIEDGYDYVSVYDLNKVKNGNINDALLVKEADTEVTYSSMKGYLIHFHSDDSVEKLGFTCKFNVDSNNDDSRIVLEKQRALNAKNCHTQMYPNDDMIYARRSTEVKFRVAPKSVQVSGVRISLQGTNHKKLLKLGEKDSTIDIVFKKSGEDQIIMEIGSEGLIGVYEIEVQVNGKNIGDNLKVFVLWNPFSPDSPVHLNNADKLQFYGFQEHGVQFVGSSDSYRARPWNYGCFTSSVLRGVARMLNSCDINTRKNIEEFTRWISYAVGNKVLHGKWGEPYTNAIKKPWEFEGSVEIFGLYANNGQPVKYGQCWVFSGLVTSASRALGIPCRSVTNFDSAHEAPKFDQIVDEYWACDANGRNCKSDKSKSRDSIWNFHVWNEAWMKNKHHPETKSTWNAFDATPQEQEDGKYQCGPYPVIKMFNGECSGKYSGEFICGETNAVQKVHFKVGDGPYELEYKDYKHVGNKACTAALDTHRCEDVSKKYKDDSRARREYSRFMEETTCKNGLVNCDNKCVSLLVSSHHCGKCNNKCRGGGICANGKCVGGKASLKKSSSLSSSLKTSSKKSSSNRVLNVQCDIIKHPGGYIMGTPIKAQCKITNNGKSSIVVESDARAEGFMYNGQILKLPILKNNNNGQNPREQDQPDFPPAERRLWLNHKNQERLDAKEAIDNMKFEFIENSSKGIDIKYYMNNGISKNGKLKLVWRNNVDESSIQWNIFDDENLSDLLPLNQVVRVKRGKSAPAFDTVSHGEVEPWHCFSIESIEEIYAFEVDDHDTQSEWVDGLRVLLDLERHDNNETTTTTNNNDDNNNNDDVVTTTSNNNNDDEKKKDIKEDTKQQQQQQQQQVDDDVKSSDDNFVQVTVDDAKENNTDIVIVNNEKEDKEKEEKKIEDEEKKKQQELERKKQLEAEKAKEHEKMMDKLSEGHEFLKFCRRAKPHNRFVKVDLTREIIDYGSGKLKLKGLLVIQKGLSTKALKYMSDLNNIDRCLSIVHKKRTLDIMADSEATRDLWFNGLNEILRQQKNSIGRSASLPITNIKNDDKILRKSATSDATRILSTGAHSEEHFNKK